jgi:tetraacyldisaccharide 4'-kinase
LQHYRLGRALEIAVVDGMRGFGNGRLLPAGPLREPEARLKRVDLVVVNGQVNSQWPEQSVFMHLQGDRLVSLQHHEKVEYFSSFPHKKIHAVAGIGHPERFFAVLRKNNFEIIEHVFPDHYLYRPEDITFADNLPVIMTEKDAVKCFAFANKQHWYLPVKAQVGAADIQKLLKRWREQDA